MQINNSVNALNNLDLKLNALAQNVASISTTQDETKPQEVTDDLINSIIEQESTVIAYKANGNAIETQNEVHDALLNIKA